jgi:hypothetical protein
MEVNKMAKKVFFSFHYQDVIDFRANVVRNHGNFKLNKGEAGFYDSSIWEEAKKTSSIALKRLINSGLQNTSNTCVLIGASTYKRPWVRYELLKSVKKGNHIFGVHINGIKCKNKETKNLGKNPLDYVGIFAEDKNSYHLIEKKDDGKWHYYKEIDSTSKVLKKHNFALNKKIPLSTIYKSYKWNADNGYKNFATWVN